jgi:hypothetical protein
MQQMRMPGFSAERALSQPSHVGRVGAARSSKVMIRPQSIWCDLGCGAAYAACLAAGIPGPVCSIGLAACKAACD